MPYYHWLVIGTFILAIFYGLIYLKERNLYVLGLFHGYPKDFIIVGDSIVKKANNDTFLVIRDPKIWTYLLPKDSIDTKRPDFNDIGFARLETRLLTKVFAIAGLDGTAIGSKTLICFSSGLTLIIKQQMLSSTIKQKSDSVPS